MHNQLTYLLIFTCSLGTCGACDEVDTNSEDSAPVSTAGDSETATITGITTDDTASEWERSDTITETSLAVTRFQTSGCDGELLNAPMQTFTEIDPDAYAGLRCISWQVTEKALLVDLLNFSDGCSIEHAGAATLTDGKLSLNLTNPTCTSTNCGNCGYSWSFRVEPAPTKINAIQVNDIGCPANDPSVYTLFDATVSDTTSTAAIQCTYPPIGLFSFDYARCGELHGPCMYQEGDTELDELSEPCGMAPNPCNDGLVCADAFEYPTTRCVAPCESDQDCPLPQLLTCQNGLCMLRNATSQQ